MTVDYNVSGVVITDIGGGGPYTPSIMIRFDGLARDTSNVLEYSIDSAFMTSTDAFSFSLYEPDRALASDLELQPVSIYIDGNLQVRGRIEVTEIGQGPGLAVSCSGRDYISDLVECNVDPAVVISENMTLDQIVKLAARSVGISAVEFDARPIRNTRTGSDIKSTLGPQKFEKDPLKDFKPNPGEGIYQLIARICARFGCTLQPTMERNSVLLCSPDYEQDAAYSVTRSIDNPKSSSNNVISAKARRDYSKFPTVVLVTGKTGVASGVRNSEVAASYKINGVEQITQTEQTFAPRSRSKKLSAAELGSAKQYDSIQASIMALVPAGVRFIFARLLPSDKRFYPDTLYRLFYMRDTLSQDKGQLENIAARNTAERLKDCLQYEVTFRGHKDPVTGRTFAVDTIIDVSDEICDVHEPLWVEHVRFSYAPGTGPTTLLTCWRPDSFLIGAEG